MPRVSIILPIYNTERYLEQCLSSIHEQTLTDIEVICVDDGSTDSSPAIMDRAAALDGRFRVIHKPNGGYGAAVNRGLDAAHGDYIGIVEPDDYVDARMFETLAAAARGAQDPDIVKGCYWRVVDADSEHEHIEPAWYHHAVAHTGRVFTLAEDAEFLFHHPSIWSAIYRRDFLRSRNIRMHEIPGAGWADNPWLIETLAQASSILYVDECLYYYREFSTGSSSSVSDPAIVHDRWIDMDRIVHELGITAPRILEGHYSRGCAYMEILEQEFDPADPAIRTMLEDMARRIDRQVVNASHKILRHHKAALWYVCDRPRYLAYRAASRVRRLMR